MLFLLGSMRRLIAQAIWDEDAGTLDQILEGSRCSPIFPAHVPSSALFLTCL
jgi:hypothetical protein